MFRLFSSHPVATKIACRALGVVPALITYNELKNSAILPTNIQLVMLPVGFIGVVTGHIALNKLLSNQPIINNISSGFFPGLFSCMWYDYLAAFMPDISSNKAIQDKIKLPIRMDEKALSKNTEVDKGDGFEVDVFSDLSKMEATGESSDWTGGW